MEHAGYQVLVAGDGDEGFRLAIEYARQIDLLADGCRHAEHVGPSIGRAFAINPPGHQNLVHVGLPGNR